jgi:putative tricarboxylic transport membrane protein
MTALAKLRRIIPYAIIFVVGAYLYHRALGFEFERVPGRVGPDLWPRMILILLMAICIYQALHLALTGAREEVEGVLQSLEEEAAPDMLEPPKEEHSARVWSGIVLTFAYIFAFQIFGFFLATFAYLAGLMVVGGYRRALPVAVVALVTTLGFMFVFMKIVYVSLPLGDEPFLAVSDVVIKLLGVH